ncbi:MAG: fumarylacetoacetate hydrolase family protein [Burkholderiaceae bacterium]
MKFASFTIDPADVHEGVGVVQGEEVVAAEAGATLLSLILDQGRSLVEHGKSILAHSSERHRLSDIHLLPPISNPPSIRDFSAFEEHVRVSMENMGLSKSPTWERAPVFYFTSPNNLVGSGAVAWAHGNTRMMDYELEIGAIIKKRGKNISVEDALDYVAGYTIFNDWSARDIQKEEMMRMPLGPGKGKDSATSIGPYLVTPDELSDRVTDKGFDLKMAARVNGRIYGEGNWNSIHWSFAQMISYASQGSFLVPGDIIASGTVGTGCIVEQAGTYGNDKYPWLAEGDIVELEVERLGVLRNVIRWDAESNPWM